MTVLRLHKVSILQRNGQKHNVNKKSIYLIKGYIKTRLDNPAIVWCF